MLNFSLQRADTTVQQHSRLTPGWMQQCTCIVQHSQFYLGVTATPSSLGLSEYLSLTSHLRPCHYSFEPSCWLPFLSHIKHELDAFTAKPHSSSNNISYAARNLLLSLISSQCWHLLLAICWHNMFSFLL